ncbi:AAA family ATPase [Mucilaginibacter sp. AW1-3]
MDIKLKDIYFNDSPEKYIPIPDLVKALEVAYALKKPLLISGEPGTGKTTFARWVAKTLEPKGFYGEPLVYNTKSSSVATDLLYYYDAVSHFRENQILSNVTVVAQEETIDNDAAMMPGNTVSRTAGIIASDVQSAKTTVDFIELKALGLAFAHATGLDSAGQFHSLFKKCGVAPFGYGAVVLIDEIDKAPRDFSNDLLNELDRYTFEIKEINKVIKLNESQRKNLIIIMTSNLEKSLPEAFLRRCVYYHIPFPTDEELSKIVMQRLNFDQHEYQYVLSKAKEFLTIRSNENLYKKPSTAEFIDWVRVLHEEVNMLREPLLANDGSIISGSPVLKYLSILLKRKEDIQLFLKSY